MSTQEMNPVDAERLELLELLAKNAGDELESALRIADLASNTVTRWRLELARRTQDRDIFRAAMEGMGCKL